MLNKDLRPVPILSPCLQPNRFGTILLIDSSYPSQVTPIYIPQTKSLILA